MTIMPRLPRTAIQHLSCLFITAALFSVPNAFAEPLVFTAIDDFPNRFEGDAPFYAEPARDALAINAGDPAFRNVFAKATTTFSGPSGVYDAVLIGLAELDGEAIYRFSVNDELLGSAQNAETSVDYMPMDHRFEGISLSTGDILSVESVANSNDLIPEGNGYAFARGRWTELRLIPAGETDVQPEKVSLITNVSSLNQIIEVGDTIAIDYAVINDDTAGATATNLRVQFNIPQNFDVTEPNSCTTVASLHSNEHILRCSVSQIAPGSSANGELFLTAAEEGTELSVHATSIANETEISGIDNRDTVFFDIEATSIETAVSVVPEEPSSVTEPEDVTGIIEVTDTIDSADEVDSQETTQETTQETSLSGTNSTTDIANSDIEEPSELPSGNIPDNTAGAETDITNESISSNSISENLIETSISDSDSTQALPESNASQSEAFTEVVDENPVSTGGVFSIGAGVTLLLFSFFNVRRFRQ